MNRWLLAILLVFFTFGTASALKLDPRTLMHFWGGDGYVSTLEMVDTLEMLDTLEMN